VGTSREERAFAHPTCWLIARKGGIAEMPKEPNDPARRRLNTSEKLALVAASVRRFVNQYGRKAQKGFEPNDRRYDRKVERAVKRMKPDQLDKLLRDDEA
jgi:hypothetical protein